MTQAKKLLSEKPDILIKDVASIVGYEDQFYFLSDAMERVKKMMN